MMAAAVQVSRRRRRLLLLVLPGQLDLFVWKPKPEEPFRLVGSPGEVTSELDLFPCATLHCPKVLVRCCLARQKASARWNKTGGESRTRDTWRGQASKYPTCHPRLCADGRLVASRVGKGEGQERRVDKARSPVRGGNHGTSERDG